MATVQGDSADYKRPDKHRGYINDLPLSELVRLQPQPNTGFHYHCEAQNSITQYCHTEMPKPEIAILISLPVSQASRKTAYSCQPDHIS